MRTGVCLVRSTHAAVQFGIVLGLIIKMIYGTHQELTFVRFQPEIFFFLLLPPIIFEAGYGLDKVRFFRNFWSIFAFAMLGTTISSFIVGFGTYAFAQAGLISFEGEDAYQSLLFGALLSATDPVATLAIMGSPELHCNSLLYTLVFGEAVLNDAVGIMLFKYVWGAPRGPASSISRHLSLLQHLCEPG